jgi:hypothetical protein
MHFSQNFIYVISGGQRTKVGRAWNPGDRMRILQSKSPDKLALTAAIGPMTELKAAAVERFAHHLMAPARLEGEWFDVTPEKAEAAVKRALELVDEGTDLPKRLPPRSLNRQRSIAWRKLQELRRNV